MKSETKELVAGALAFLTAVVVFYLIGASSVLHGRSDTYTLSARFNQTDGLIVGSDVRLAGLKVGRVVSQRLDDYYGVVVTFSLPKHIQLPEDSGAAVQSSGLIGTKYIELQPGGAEDMLQTGDFIEFTQDSPNLQNLLDKVISLSKANRQKQKSQ